MTTGIGCSYQPSPLEEFKNLLPALKADQTEDSVSKPSEAIPVPPTDQADYHAHSHGSASTLNIEGLDNFYSKIHPDTVNKALQQVGDLLNIKQQMNKGMSLNDIRNLAHKIDIFQLKLTNTMYKMDNQELNQFAGALGDLIADSATDFQDDQFLNETLHKTLDLMREPRFELPNDFPSHPVLPWHNKWNQYMID